jgi:hypothetical protein
MRPLEALKDNYLYQDWAEVVQSVSNLEWIHSRSEDNEEYDRGLRRLFSLLSQGAFFKRTDRINWRIPADALSLSPQRMDELTHIGRLMDRFLRAVDRSLDSYPLTREMLGFPACPEEEWLRERQGGVPLTFFRLDLAMDDNHHYKLLEVQVVMGGLGIVQALREAYGPHPTLRGAAALYEEAVIAGYRNWRLGNDQAPSTLPLIGVPGSKKSAYRHEHLVLARHLKRLDMVVFPLLLLSEDCHGGLVLPDGRVPKVIHRLFRSPSIFDHSPKRAQWLLKNVRDAAIYLANPWNDVMEDKRIMALVHHPQAPQMMPDCLAPHEWNDLKRYVPETFFADGEIIADLMDLPRGRRGFYLKKGRSFEGRHLCDGQQVNLREWKDACMRALDDGDWIVQEAVRGEPWPLRYVDLHTRAVREMSGHVRISPFYFRRSDGDVDLGDVLITAREERSRVHGASDALLGVPGMPG